MSASCDVQWGVTASCFLSSGAAAQPGTAAPGIPQGFLLQLGPCLHWLYIVLPAPTPALAIAP